MNLNSTIIPKSDQLNSDDLIAGPITIKITAVEAGSTEQPVSIHYEGEKGRPYKPSKSMRRVLVCIWGPDGNAYVGRRLTLYRDPAIKFGGEPVGGIRISHASNLSQAAQLALTETRGKRKPFCVEPLEEEPAPQMPENWNNWTLAEQGENRATAGLQALQAWWKALPKEDRAELTDLLPAWKETASKVQNASS